MKGTLNKTEEGWLVEYLCHQSKDDKRCFWKRIPLHPSDVSTCIKYSDYSIDWIGKQVEFEIEEFWETGLESVMEVAKLIENTEYPELQGTIDLCQDIVNRKDEELEADKYLMESNRQAFLHGVEWQKERTQSAPSIESVPAPGDPETELRRVRQYKNRHVKAQNWELAALYREIEKLLQKQERTCSNCQMLLHAVGVGQGLICDLNKCRIPHSKHICDKHEYKKQNT
jgi:hypothetical protein